jgi:hypothetical protein
MRFAGGVDSIAGETRQAAGRQNTRMAGCFALQGFALIAAVAARGTADVMQAIAKVNASSKVPPPG